MSDLQFKKITLKDIPIIKKYLKENYAQITDWSIGGIFLWRDLYQIEYAIYDETLILKVMYYQKHPAFCVKCEKIKTSVRNQIKKYCLKHHLPLVFCLVDECTLDILKKEEEILFIKEERDLADYLYLLEDISSYRGKKYQTQRNHVNCFLKEYKVERYIWDGLDNQEILAFLDEFYQNNPPLNNYLLEEKNKTLELFTNPNLYHFHTVLLKANNKIVGLAAGEIINDTVYQHIEKAFSHYCGAYAYLAKSFAESLKNYQLKYLNREDDNGDEGLRYSKLKYRPIKLLNKYTVEVLNV